MNSPRPWYWSIRREIWENRSVYIAPLAVATFVLFGFFFSTFHLPQRLLRYAADPGKQQPFNAVWRYADGELTPMITDLALPNVQSDACGTGSISITWSRYFGGTRECRGKWASPLLWILRRDHETDAGDENYQGNQTQWLFHLFLPFGR